MTMCRGQVELAGVPCSCSAAVTYGPRLQVIKQNLLVPFQRPVSYLGLAESCSAGSDVCVLSSQEMPHGPYPCTSSDQCMPLHARKAKPTTVQCCVFPMIALAHLFSPSAQAHVFYKYHTSTPGQGKCPCQCKPTCAHVQHTVGLLQLVPACESF